MRRRPSILARLVAAIAGVVMLALAAIPTIGLAALFTLNAGPATSFSPRPSASGTVRPSPSPSPTPTPAPTGLISEPDVSPSPSESGAPTESAVPEESGDPTESPSPSPVAGPLALNLGGRKAFVSQVTEKWCASAAIQSAVNMIVTPVDLTKEFQKAIELSAVEYTTAKDSRNGGWGPRGVADAMTTLTGRRYSLKILDDRDTALRTAATAIAATRHPAILFAWRGAHAWVMTGYKVNRDPLGTRTFTVSGAYILDPWFPRVSNIWGRSKDPGAWHDRADLARNILPWRRPEARYPGRDGKFLVIIPTEE